MAFTRTGARGGGVENSILYNDGSSYGIALRADPKDLAGFVRPRWIYVFLIDSSGKSTLLFPRPEWGNVENRFPAANADMPAQIQLGPPKLFKVSPPYGTDTYFLLTTAEAIDPSVLEFDGVRASTRGTPAQPLERLLTGVGRRGASVATPSNWSISQMSVRSAPKP